MYMHYTFVTMILCNHTLLLRKGDEDSHSIVLAYVQSYYKTNCETNRENQRLH